jgi:HEAT repeat protein
MSMLDRDRVRAPSRLLALAALVAFCFAASACGEKSGDAAGQASADARSEVWVPDPELLDLVEGEDPGRDDLLDRMEALRAPVSRSQAEALLRVMKDKSQQAFITVPTANELGFRVEESPYGGPDLRCEVRWTAIMTIERLGLVEALPDLLSALHDRHPVVRHHAAKALWTFGSDAGLPVLLEGLRGRAFSNESAALILREITGKSFGFDTDGGWKNKSEAIEAWRRYLESEDRPQPTLPKAGDDPHLDRRVRFLVDVLGQHQFLFMEQSRRALSDLGDLAVHHLEAGIAADGNDQLRAYGVQALEKIATPRARALLERLLREDEDGAVRLRAAQALGVIGDPASETVLRAALQDRDEGVVATAALALGALGAKDSVEALRAVLRGEKAPARLRWTAAIGLARASGGDAEAGDHLLQIMREAPALRRTELAADLAEWRPELEGWEAKAEPSLQTEALSRWESLLK